jgi:hypothetical protein
MNNLSTPASYEGAPTAPTSLQSGGRGYRHKKSCKCPLCKKRGGGNGGEDEGDIETGPLPFEKDDAYDDDLLLAAEEGRAGPGVKTGGSRRRKHSKKSRKGGKSRKTRRHSRKGKKHGRKTHRRRH